MHENNYNTDSTDSDSDDENDLEGRSLEHLQNNYANVKSPVAYLGANKLYYYYNRNISHAKIRKFLSSNESYTLMTPERKSRIFDRTLTFSAHDIIQFDLIEVCELSESNGGITQIICGIDCYTKVAYCQGLLSKHCTLVAQEMYNILIMFGFKPNIVSMDRGSEFNCKTTKALLKKMGVKAYYSQGNYKCAVIERFQSTFQRLIYAHLTEHETLTFIDKLQEFVRIYNTSFNRSIGMTPFEANNPINKNVLDRKTAKYRMKDRAKKIKPTFSIGDTVRLSIKKSKFHRAYNYQNTLARYIIERICLKHIQPCYFKKNENGESLTGRFYAHELVLTNILTYRSNVIKERMRKGQKEFLVHYKGYDSSYDQWLRKGQLQKIT